MCGKNIIAPDVPYVTHASIREMLDSDKYVQEEFPVSFQTADGRAYTYKSVIAYRKDAAPKPLVMVFPNYAGLKQFDKDQALFLAKLGYVGLAVDLYEEVDGYRYEDRNPIVTCDNGETPAIGDCERAPPFETPLSGVSLSSSRSRRHARIQTPGCVGDVPTPPCRCQCA
jgi:hypothetical protein